MTPETETPPSRPLRILVVEDYWLVAMQVQMMLEKIGCEVVGPVGTVEEALKIVDAGDLAGAILDVSLGDVDSFEVASALEADGVPFAFSTGASADSLPARHRVRPYLAKPIQEAMVSDFVETIRRDQRSNGAARP